MTERLDYGIVLALAYSAFVDEMRTELAALGHDDLHRSFGYVARALSAESLTLRELAERLAISSPGALKIVDEMERSGHVERVADAVDRRAKRLRLTRHGKAALAAARKFHARFEARLVARVGAAKARHCRAVLEAMILERTLAGAPPALRPM